MMLFSLCRLLFFQTRPLEEAPDDCTYPIPRINRKPASKFNASSEATMRLRLENVPLTILLIQPFDGE